MKGVTVEKHTVVDLDCAHGSTTSIGSLQDDVVTVGMLHDLERPSTDGLGNTTYALHADRDAIGSIGMERVRPGDMVCTMCCGDAIA